MQSELATEQDSAKEFEEERRRRGDLEQRLAAAESERDAFHDRLEANAESARDLEHRPVGPRPGGIPLVMGAKGPRMLDLAVRHADTWSWYVEERSDLEEFGPRLAAMEAACLAAGRDPATIGRSAGIVVEPTAVTGAADVLGVPVAGSAAEIATAFRGFEAGGFTQLELMLWPPTMPALEAMAPVLAELRRG